MPDATTASTKNRHPKKRFTMMTNVARQLLASTTSTRSQPLFSPSSSSLPLVILSLSVLLGRISWSATEQECQHGDNHQQQQRDYPDNATFVSAFVLPLYTWLVLLYVGARLLHLWIFSKLFPTPPAVVLPAPKPQSKVYKEPSQPLDIDHDNDNDTIDDLLEGDMEAKEKVDDKTMMIAPFSLPLVSSLSQPPSAFNLTGAYRLISNSNYEEYLAVQGVPWALRRAANQARPIHRITHDGTTLTIKIEGIIESQTTYIINGPPVETNVRGRLFIDQVSYTDDGQGIQVCKTAIAEDYDVTVTRRLSEDGQQIVLTGCAVFRDERKPIQAVQIFQRIME